MRAALPLLLVVAVLLAPLVEELVFRGFLFDAWQRRWGWLASAVLTSAVFAVYHRLFANAFLGSLVFICVLRRTGSLWTAIIAHAVSNLLLWYPLLGQFVLPGLADRGELPFVWLPHMVALPLTIALLPIYLALAGKRPAFQA